MANAIELDGVTKTFGDKVAVRDLQISVREGALVGLIGPNGAGKTTTIRMIMSILFQDSGRISVLGCNSALEAKDRIGYLPEERGVYKRMKVGAFLRYIARLKGFDGADVKSKVSEWLARVDLPDVENKKCEELSKGMQQKVQFISAVIHEPDLVILDEPFSGLDPVNMRLLRDLVQEQHNRGATVIFSTHVMFQAEQLCDQILMINGGRKVLDDSLSSIRRRYDPRMVLVEALDPACDMTALGRLNAVTAVTKSERSHEVHLASGADVSAVIREIAATIPVARVELQRPTLEDVFVQIVNESKGGSVEDLHALRKSLRGQPTPEMSA